MMNVALRPQFGLVEPQLRDAMRHLVGGVSVITAGIGDERTGLTATSAVSLSVDPPTMVIAVNRDASAWPIIQRHRPPRSHRPSQRKVSA